MPWALAGPRPGMDPAVTAAAGVLLPSAVSGTPAPTAPTPPPAWLWFAWPGTPAPGSPHRSAWDAPRGMSIMVGAESSGQWAGGASVTDRVRKPLPWQRFPHTILSAQSAAAVSAHTSGRLEGPAGLAGLAGPAGPAGLAAGPAGLAGLERLAGPAGLSGPPGLAGPVGLAGRPPRRGRRAWSGRGGRAGGTTGRMRWLARDANGALRVREWGPSEYESEGPHPAAPHGGRRLPGFLAVCDRPPVWKQQLKSRLPGFLPPGFPRHPGSFLPEGLPP